MVRWLIWTLIAALLPLPGLAASYLRTDGSVVDPILFTAAQGGGVHPYTGTDLGPAALLNGAPLAGARLDYADLAGADLSGAQLAGAQLFAADLTGVDFLGADLSGASLTGAVAAGANFAGADLTGADFAGVDLTGARNLGTATGAPRYSNTTVFTNAWTGEPGSDPFDPVAAGWTPAPDADFDTVSDSEDNCRLLANKAPQDCDDDDDGYGNACDGDFDQNFAVNALDFTTVFVPAFKAAAGGITDMDCNGTNAGSADFSTKFVPQFKLGKPGPSGLVCAGTVACDL